MKKILVVAAMLSSIVAAATPSWALVRLVNSCDTSDGAYSITILDNQGIGPVRTSHLGATIKDADDNVVATYALTEKAGSHSVSFGHKSLVDTATDGQEFNFAYPSTNTPFAVQALLIDGQSIAYGLRFAPVGVNQGALVCKW